MVQVKINPQYNRFPGARIIDLCVRRVSFIRTSYNPEGRRRKKGESCLPQPSRVVYRRGTQPAASDVPPFALLIICPWSLTPPSIINPVPTSPRFPTTSCRKPLSPLDLSHLSFLLCSMAGIRQMKQKNNHHYARPLPNQSPHAIHHPCTFGVNRAPANSKTRNKKDLMPLVQ